MNGTKNELKKIECADTGKIIQVHSRGKIYHTIVDSDDYEYLNQFRWNLDSKGYVQARINNKTVRINRLIMLHHNIDIKDKIVDHISRDILDNRKCNLRVANDFESSWNTGCRKSVSKTGYKGVHPKNNGRFIAHIMFNGNKFEIGAFDNVKQAAIAYDIYAKKYHGEFAFTNVPNATQEEISEVIDLINKIDRWENKTSKYRGVSHSHGSIVSYISCKGKRYHLGSFESEIDAAIAYNKKATELLGDKAKLNII